jgi:hypothetical protein
MQIIEIVLGAQGRRLAALPRCSIRRPADQIPGRVTMPLAIHAKNRIIFDMRQCKGASVGLVWPAGKYGGQAAP